MSKILAFAGSQRAESINKKLVTIAARAAEQAGAEVTLVDMRDYSMPLYDSDLEQAEGLPANALAFKRLLQQHDGFLIASPEYNSAFTPLLKNIIDWSSRAETPDEPKLSAFKGKVAAIMAAAPGAMGGYRGLVFLRMLLNNLGVTVLPEQLAIGDAFKAFDAQGQLIDPTQQQQVEQLGIKLTDFAGRLKMER